MNKKSLTKIPLGMIFLYLILFSLLILPQIIKASENSDKGISIAPSSTTYYTKATIEVEQPYNIDLDTRSIIVNKEEKSLTVDGHFWVDTANETQPAGTKYLVLSFNDTLVNGNLWYRNWGSSSEWVHIPGSEFGYIASKKYAGKTFTDIYYYSWDSLPDSTDKEFRMKFYFDTKPDSFIMGFGTGSTIVYVRDTPSGNDFYVNNGFAYYFFHHGGYVHNATDIVNDINYMRGIDTNEDTMFFINNFEDGDNATVTELEVGDALIILNITSGETPDVWFEAQFWKESFVIETYHNEYQNYCRWYSNLDFWWSCENRAEGPGDAVAFSCQDGYLEVHKNQANNPSMIVLIADFSTAPNYFDSSKSWDGAANLEMYLGYPGYELTEADWDTPKYMGIVKNPPEIQNETYTASVYYNNLIDNPATMSCSASDEGENCTVTCPTGHRGACGNKSLSFEFIQYASTTGNFTILYYENESIVDNGLWQMSQNESGIRFIIPEEISAGDTAWYINYTISLDSTPPTWSDVGQYPLTPKVNEEVKFSTYWTELESALDKYIFNWNGTGTWTNNTETFSTNWSNITKTITKPHVSISWKIYANNIFELMNDTPIQTFYVINTQPTQDNPLLTTPTGKNLSTEDLTCYNKSTYDADNDVVTNIYNWFKNGVSMLVLNMPFEINANDYSEYNNDGTVNGTISSTGQIGNAYQFDGINDYINVPDSNSLDFINTKTWEIWFKRATTGISQVLFDKTNSSNYTNYKLYLDAANKLIFSYTVPYTIEGEYVWDISTPEDFDQGSYSNTNYSIDHVQLVLPSTTGTYTSDIKDVDSGATVLWKNIYWSEELPSGKAELEPEEGMVGLWHMNNDWLDSSDNNNDGTGQGGAGFTTDSKLGSHAGSFDGTDDYVNFGDIANFDRTDPFSLEFWFKTTTTSVDVLLDRYGDSRGWTIYLSDGKLVFALTSASGNFIKKTTVSTYTDSAWYHAVLTYSGSGIAGGVILYINGEAVSMDINADSLTGTTLNDFNCSMGSRGTTLYFEGTMDETAIYNKTLSASEIQEHYNRSTESYNTNITLQVRSCDDSACSGESFVGPDGTSSTYYTDADGEDLNVDINRYFQFKSYLETTNTDYTPELYDVSVGYTKYTSEKTTVNISSATSITDTTNWHHAVVSYGNNNLSLYINDVLDNTKTEAILPIGQDNSDLYIGRRAIENDQYFNGKIDEFRIYDTVLTPEQINNNHNLNYNIMKSSETTGGETYKCQITPNDGYDNGTTKDSNDLTVLWNITFNITSGEDGSQLSNVNVVCNNTWSVSGISSPYSHGFLAGGYSCLFELWEHYNRTITFTAYDDKIVNVKMSEKKWLTIEEHNWIEAIYKCLYEGDCLALDFLYNINQTVSDLWDKFKLTDESVVIDEDITNRVINSTANLTIDYNISLPQKQGYGEENFLPLRISYYFLDETNTTCYNQGEKPVGLTGPYCQSLVAYTGGKVSSDISFTVELRPELPAGEYTIVRNIQIDPDQVWIEYGQEIIGKFTVTESTTNPAIGLASKTIPTTSSWLTTAMAISAQAKTNISLIISLITLSMISYLIILRKRY